MGARRAIFEWLSRGASLNLANAQQWAGVLNVGGGPVTNIQGLNKPAENVVMVYGCIKARREAIGSVPMRLSDGADCLVESGPEFDLLERPNQSQDWGQYVRELETSLTLYDAVAIALVGEPGQLPLELIPLNVGGLTAQVGHHEVTGTPVVVGWDYVDPWTGAHRLFSRDEVIVQQGYNPHAPMSALSPIAVLRQTMESDLCAREQNRRLFANDARPSSVLTNERAMTKEQASEVLDFVEARLRGVENRHRPIAMWGGMKLETVGLTPQELDFLNGLKFLRTDYYIAFRVTPAMLFEIQAAGLGQGNESTDAQERMWWQNVGLGELTLLAGIHQGIVGSRKSERGTRKSEGGRRKALSRAQRLARGRFVARASAVAGRNIQVWFDDDQIPALVQHRLARLAQLKTLTDIGWQPDEASDYLGLDLPPHPDNLGRVAFSLTTIGQDAPPAAPASVAQGDGALGALQRVERLLARAERTPPPRAALEAFVAPRVKAGTKRWSRFFVEQRGRVLQRLKGEVGGQGAEVSRADGTGVGSEQSTVGGSDRLLAAIFPRSEEDAHLIARLSPLWVEGLKDGWNYFKREMSLPETVNPFQIADPRTMAAIEKRKIQGLEINATTHEDIRAIIRQGMEAGDSTMQIGDKIAEYYAGQIGEDAVRPGVAARTQVAGIVNDGRLAAAQEFDDGSLVKYWAHGASGDPRENHVEMAQRYDAAHGIPVSEKFILHTDVGDLECDAPLDSELPPGEICNCKCSLEFAKAVGRKETT